MYLATERHARRGRTQLLLCGARNLKVPIVPTVAVIRMTARLHYEVDGGTETATGDDFHTESLEGFGTLVRWDGVNLHVPTERIIYVES